MAKNKDFKRKRLSLALANITFLKTTYLFFYFLIFTFVQYFHFYFRLVVQITNAKASSFKQNLLLVKTNFCIKTCGTFLILLQVFLNF